MVGEYWKMTRREFGFVTLKARSGLAPHFPVKKSGLVSEVFLNKYWLEASFAEVERKERMKNVADNRIC